MLWKSDAPASGCTSERCILGRLLVDIVNERPLRMHFGRFVGAQFLKKIRASKNRSKCIRTGRSFTISTNKRPKIDTSTQDNRYRERSC